MALETGTRIGSYEISDLLGKGGMGEVYRARDTKLGREVAIKVLPSEFAQDEERLARLEREARMLAALNHPNIAAIYGLEQSDDTRFLVLELVEGDTLADRLHRAAIPVEESLTLALQIAEALETAHERGVIHRDLKPANIKITPEGRVKVLDFGLAKAFVGDRPDMGLSNSPTLSIQATQQGMILGTASYMSPEQARGDTVDHRADIWAFGCVLSEMLTGQQTWSGRTVTDIIGGIVAREPDWSRLPPTLNPRVRFLLERCLEKEQKDRCQGVAEARVEIQKALSEGGSSSGPVPIGVVARPLAVLPWIGALGLALVASAAVWFLRPASPATPGVIARFDQELAASEFFRNTGRDVVAISRDGTQLVYNTTAGLYLRKMDEIEPRLISGTEGGLTNPFFSPDGDWIGYWDGPAGELRKIRPTGGASVLLTATGNPQGASWSMDDSIVFGRADGIVRVPGDGGSDPEVIVPAREGEQLWDPQILPDGSVLFTAWISPTEPMISLQRVGSDERAELFAGERAIYVPTGHLVATDPQASPNTLLARSFDLDTLAFGGAVPVEEGVALGVGDKAHYAVSSAGSLAYIVADASSSGGGSGVRPARTLVWVSREGVETTLGAEPDDYTMARISPDGSKVALVVGSVFPAISDPAPDIWILDLVTGARRQLTFSPEVDDMPVWHSSSDLLYFRQWGDGQSAIYSIPADGGDGEPVLIGTSPEFPNLSPWSLSPDDTRMAFNYGESIQDINLATLSLDGEATFTDLLSGPGIEVEPVISPNGAWLAYQRTIPEGGGEINVRPFPGVATQRTPVGAGQHPRFSTDGSELFYFDGEGISVRSVGYAPGFFTGPAEELFRGEYWYGAGGPDGFGGRAWDLDPEGERLLMISLPAFGEGGPPDEQDTPRINIVLNWFEELRERVPVD